MRGNDHALTFFRFLIVGGSFSLFYALVTSGLIRFAAAPPLITSVVVYLVCIPLAFTAQRTVAFRSDTSAKRGVWIYAATQIISLTVVSMIASQLVTRIFWVDTGLYLLTAGCAAVVSYLICRFIIFRQG